MNAFNFLANPIVDALGWTLLHAIWQGFALVLPIALFLHLLRNQSSALRYRVSVLTLLGQVLLSAATFIWYYKPTVQLSVQASSAITARYATPIRWQAVVQTLPWHQQIQHFLEAHLSQFVFGYLIGVALFGLRLAGGWVYLQRLSQTATKPTTIVWAHLTDKLRSALAIRAAVQVRESVQIAVPMVVGVLKPILLLPIGLATHLTTSEIEAVLAHELAHIKRHDYAVNLLQSVVEVLYFFHPALWWLSARVREEREHCCDDLAVQVCGGNGRILAQALARVEELRLTQISQTPALAMAFASKRQQLLHRVRRMLGVPTRPFVSTSSLAGLTLATILLMSVSVYAIQKQGEPKRKVTQPKPSHSTRRHSKGNGTEYGMIDDKKVYYVIWKGQKLPAKRVVRLQRQLDQVMAGKLSLDNVAQPDRDILLTIIETNQSFDSGMNSLAEGLSHVNYNNIIASALNNVPSTLDAAAELANVNDRNAGYEAVDSIPANGSPDSFGPTLVYDLILRQDSLLNLQDLNRGKIASLKAKAQSQRFAVEAVERSIERLERQKSVLEQRRFSQTMKQQQTILQSGFAKTDSAQTTYIKQIETGEATIRKTESEIDAMNRQIINIQDELEKVENPLRETESQLRGLEHSSYGLGTTIGSGFGPKGVTGTSAQSLRATGRLSPIKASRPAKAPHPPTQTIPSPPDASTTAPVSPAQVARPFPKPAIAPKAEKPE